MLLRWHGSPRCLVIVLSLRGSYSGKGKVASWFTRRSLLVNKSYVPIWGLTLLQEIPAIFLPTKKNTARCGCSWKGYVQKVEPDRLKVRKKQKKKNRPHSPKRLPSVMMPYFHVLYSTDIQNFRTSKAFQGVELSWQKVADHGATVTTTGLSLSGPRAPQTS